MTDVLILVLTFCFWFTTGCIAGIVAGVVHDAWLVRRADQRHRQWMVSVQRDREQQEVRELRALHRREPV